MTLLSSFFARFSGWVFSAMSEWMLGFFLALTLWSLSEREDSDEIDSDLFAFFCDGFSLVFLTSSTFYDSSDEILIDELNCLLIGVTFV